MNARVPTLPTPYDLVGHVDDVELLEEVAAVVLQRLAVVAELFVDHVFQLVDGESDAWRQVS